MAVISIVLCLVNFFVYLLTLSPSIFVGDSGELITAAYVLGVPHPPGYPMFCVIGKIFTVLLPFADIAYRTNLMQAFFATASVFILFFILKEIFKEKNNIFYAVISAGVSLMFGFSQVFWSQAIISEVYILNAFFILLILFIFTKTVLSGKTGSKPVFLSFYIWALSLSNHHSAVFLFPVFLYYLWKLFISKKYESFYFLTALFALGLLFYIYLPMRALASPTMNWGDPSTLRDLIRTIRRAEYGSPISPSTRTFSLFLSQSASYFSILFRQFTPFLIVFSLPGIYYLFRHNKTMLAVFLLIFISTSFGWIWILNFTLTAEQAYLIEVFYIPSFIIAAVFIGCGLKLIIDLARRSYAKTALPVALSAVCVFLPLKSNYETNDLSDNYITYCYGADLLDSAEKGGVLFIAGDNETFPAGYVKKVEDYRPDLSVYDDIGAVFYGIYAKYLLKLSTEEAVLQRDETQNKFIEESKKPLFCTIGSNVYNKPGKFAIPNGLAYQLSKKKFEEFSQTRKFWLTSRFNTIGSWKQDDYYIRSLLAKYRHSMGEFYALLGEKSKALKQYLKANEIGSDMPWIQNNLAIAYANSGLMDEAAESLENSEKLDKNDPIIHKNLAHLYLGKGMYDKAIEHAILALKLKQHLYDPYEVLTEAYEKKEMHDKAIQAGLIALKYNPFSHKVYFQLGNAYMKLGQMDKAIEYYQATVSAGSREPEAHNNLAGIFIGRKLFDKAIYECKRALILHPDYTEAYNNLGIAYASKKMFNEAVEAFKKSIELNPKDIDILFNLGLVYRG